MKSFNFKQHQTAKFISPIQPLGRLFRVKGPVTIAVTNPTTIEEQIVRKIENKIKGIDGKSLGDINQ